MIPPYKGPEIATQVNIELPNSPEFQLYNLDDDIAQQKNLAKSNQDKLEKMIMDYTAIVGSQNSDLEPLELK